MPYLVIFRRGVSNKMVIALSDTKKTPIVIKEVIQAELESYSFVVGKARQFAFDVSRLFNPELEIKEENI